jgi:hypothetical protein
MPKSVLRRSRDDDEDDNVVKDGEIYRVPLMFMDNMQRAVRQDALYCRARVVDAFDNSAGYRPGYCFAADAGLIDGDGSSDDPRVQAWQERDRRMRDAWRDPKAWFAANTASPQLDRPPPNPPPRLGIDANDTGAHAEADRAYEERGRRLGEAWRHA